MMSIEQQYDAWHRRVHGGEPDAKVVLQQWHRDALSLCPPLAGASTLEIGCGVGDFALHVSQQAARVVAIDFSPAAIELAARKAATSAANVQFRIGDAEQLPFDSELFDIVFSCECLEHLPNPKRALQEMYRVLRSNGVLILTTENYSNAMVIYWIMAWLRGEPFNSGSGVQPIERFFVFWVIKRMLRAAGFRVERMIGAHHVFFALPGCHPHLFVRDRFRSRFLAFVFRPFARHVSFRAVKP